MTSLSSLRARGSCSSSSSIPEDSLEVPPPWFIRDVKVLQNQVLGQGSYGTVHVACWQGCEVAVKRLHDIFFEASVTPESKRGILRAFARELNVLYQLKHPNIVQFFGVYKASGIQTFELTSDTYLVQELMCCALDVRNRKHPKLNLCNIVNIGLGIASALRYLHEREEPIIHRDLATKNILLGYNGTAKISDLGVAKILKGGHSTPHTRQPGTELYMPPEVKIEGMVYDTRIDIFSFGVILLEVSIGRDVSAGEAFRIGTNGMLCIVPEIDRRKKDFQDLGDHILKPFIMQCLSPREARPTAKQITDYLTSLKENNLQYQSKSEIPIFPSSAVSESPSLNDESSKKLSARCELLEEKVAVLMADKQHLEHKLDAYISSERAENEESQQEISRQAMEIEKLKAENVHLQKLVGQKDTEISRLSSLGSPLASLTGPQLRDQRATLLQRINELQVSKQTEVGRLQKEVEELKSDNAALRRKITTRASIGRAYPSSLPPQLSSQPPSLSSLSISGNNYQEPVPSHDNSELKKLKRLLERYKTVNVELDMKLKDARLELQKYEHRQTDSDVMYRTDVGRLREENERMRAQLERTLQENFRLQRDLSVMHLRPY